MSVPQKIRDEVSARLWRIADEIGWLSLSDVAKSRYYDNWTRDPEIGERLARFLDPGQVRLYIKDAIMKRHARARKASPTLMLRHFGVADAPVPEKTFIKPHGCQLPDGRVICWGRAGSWKLVITAVHERAFVSKGAPFGAALTQAAFHFADDAPRAVVEDAAKRLGIKQLVWLLD